MPHNDGRYLQRNAIVALGNTGQEHLDCSTASTTSMRLGETRIEHARDDRPRHLRDTERWIASVRLGAVAFAVVQVVLSTGYPPGYKRDAWIVTVVFAVGAVVLFVLSRREIPVPRQLVLAVIRAARSTRRSSPRTCSSTTSKAGARSARCSTSPSIEAAVRFGIIGPLLLTVLTMPVLIEFEHLRAEQRR